MKILIIRHDAIYCSPLGRAKDTAAATLEPLSLAGLYPKFEK